MTSTLETLLKPGVLGFFTAFEVTEIFANPPGETPVNVLTIIVVEEAITPTPRPAIHLSDRIKLKSLSGWSFGIERYSRPVVELVPAVQSLTENGQWSPSGDPARIGKLHELRSQFVPADGGGPIPLNRLLKNNFWNGSHVFEWSDREKTLLRPLFDDPRRIQELSDQLEKSLPIGLAAASDRLGNLIIQVPVTVVMSKFGQVRTSGQFQVEIAWHPKATPRPLRASCQMEFDGIVSGYASAPVQAGKNLLPSPSGRGLMRGALWDDENHIVLAATAPTGFISTISMGGRILDPEPRTFSMRLSDGTIEHRRVRLSAYTKTVVGEPQGDDNGGWTERRMYQERASHLAAERRFVQYRPKPHERGASHQKALNDIRALMSQFGMEGVWLWDPYLRANDVFETLFYCPHSGVELRALTAGKELDGKRPDFVPQERAELDGSNSNWRGLKLEFRIQQGTAGWAFHDRFLIFPATENGALAWSLGTSINSLGKEHHILQQVDNGQLVSDAFQDLWDQLAAPQHLIWKKS